ncbi:S41 family peptidase [bacterium]|nr:S41 family peptidase [Balneola sp.]MBR9916861.1 S41 family peptidase [bacterium]
MKKAFFLIYIFFFGGLATSLVQAQQTDIYFLIKKNFSIFSKTYENVALDYVDEIDPEKLMRIGLDAMLETLDPYTVIYNEAQNEQAEILSRGNYAGIGIEAGYRDGKVVIIAPTEGGPAERSGLRAGDEIIEIDGISTMGLKPEEIQTLTIGEVGSKVDISIKRFGVEKALDFELTRQRIEVKNVSHQTLIGSNKQIGYIKLSQFGLRSADEIRTSIIELKEQAELKGLVLDLRDNPGGILQEAVSIIDKFVEPGLMVVENRGRIAEYNQTFSTTEPIFFDQPVVVLVNGGSASASEVVSGALQDLDRAVIVGEQSFGKGLVQIVKPLPYNTSMKVTIARYYIPSGRSIQSIDYTHEGRNSGVVKREASSNVFKTKNGRTVNEGRGIEPDIVVEVEEPNLIEISLLQKGAIFDFSTEYFANNSNAGFDDIPEGIFNEFKLYLDKIDFEFANETEDYLEVIRKDLAGVEGAEIKIRELQKFIDLQQEQELNNSKEFIEKMIWLELKSRTGGQTARTNASLSKDVQLNAAVDLINNPQQIDSLLKGSN